MCLFISLISTRESHLRQKLLIIKLMMAAFHWATLVSVVLCVQARSSLRHSNRTETSLMLLVTPALSLQWKGCSWLKRLACFHTEPGLNEPTYLQYCIIAVLSIGGVRSHRGDLSVKVSFTVLLNVHYSIQCCCFLCGPCACNSLIFN